MQHFKMGDAIAVPYCVTAKPCASCTATNYWRLLSTFTILTSNGKRSVNPLVAQAIGDALAILLRIDNVIPTVIVYPGKPLPGSLDYLYVVQVMYPRAVQGRRTAADGTLCDEIIKVPIPQVESKAESEAQLATTNLVPGTEWYDAVVFAANTQLGLNSVELITFSKFRVSNC